MYSVSTDDGTCQRLDVAGMSCVQMTQLRHSHTEFDRVLVQIYFSGIVAGKMVLKSFSNSWTPSVLRGIMGNQGKFTKKQSCKTYVLPYISVLMSRLEMEQ